MSDPQVGSDIVISTSSYNTWETEKRKVTAVSSDGRVLTLDLPLTHTHLGILQFYFLKICQFET